MLQDVTMASSTGTLTQIGLLSHYAAELFSDLFTTAQSLQERLDSASSRVRTLNEQLPRVCDVVARCDGDSVHRSGTLPEREHPQRVQFTVETMPRGLRERYDALEPPPDFSRIDALLPPEVLEKEGPSSQKFSHPGLFLDQWAQEELRKMEELKKRRQEEREERRRRRKAQREMAARKPVKPIPKVEAPPLIQEDVSEAPEPAPPTPSTREEAPPTIEIPEDEPPVVPPPTIDNSPSARESEDYAKYARMLRMGVPKPAVAAKMAAEGLDPSVLDDSDDDSAASPVEPVVVRKKPPPPPMPRKKPPPPPMPKSPPKQKPPPPPMKPKATAPAMPSGLLGAIQRGAALKEVDAAPPPQRPESALLQAIKSGGTLRKVVREQKPRPARRGLFGGEVDKILALRARVGAETDSSSGSDWGSDSG